MTKIMKGGIAYNSTANMVALTQSEYDALTTAQKNNGNFYFITDTDPTYFSSENIDYDNTTSGLSATNIQDAIDEVSAETANKSWTLIGTLSEGGTGVSVSAYSELLVYLKINNTTYYNPYLIDVAEFNNTSTIFLSIYQDSTHTYLGGIDYSNGTITWRKVLIAGWTNCYAVVKAR